MSAIAIRPKLYRTEEVLVAYLFGETLLEKLDKDFRHFNTEIPKDYHEFGQYNYHLDHLLSLGNFTIREIIMCEMRYNALCTQIKKLIAFVEQKQLARDFDECLQMYLKDPVTNDRVIIRSKFHSFLLILKLNEAVLLINQQVTDEWLTSITCIGVINDEKDCIRYFRKEYLPHYQFITDDVYKTPMPIDPLDELSKEFKIVDTKLVAEMLSQTEYSTNSMTILQTISKFHEQLILERKMWKIFYTSMTKTILYIASVLFQNVFKYYIDTESFDGININLNIKEILLLLSRIVCLNITPADLYMLRVNHSRALLILYSHVYAIKLRLMAKNCQLPESIVTLSNFVGFLIVAYMYEAYKMAEMDLLNTNVYLDKDLTTSIQGTHKRHIDVYKSTVGYDQPGVLYVNNFPKWQNRLRDVETVGDINLSGYYGICTICSEGMKNKRLAILPKCVHVFHLKCFSEYIKGRYSEDLHNFCPTCKSVCEDFIGSDMLEDMKKFLRGQKGFDEYLAPNEPVTFNLHNYKL